VIELQKTEQKLKDALMSIKTKTDTLPEKSDKEIDVKQIEDKEK